MTSQRHRSDGDHRLTHTAANAKVIVRNSNSFLFDDSMVANTLDKHALV